MMSQSVSWMSSGSNVMDVENKGIFAGYQADGSKVFVGRTMDKNGKFLPAKVLPSLSKSFYAFDDKEMSSDMIEYLPNVEGYEWIKSSDGAVVPEAVSVSNYYVGRGVYNGNMVVGRVDMESKKLVGCFGGNTFNLSSYDVLVFKPQGHKNFEKSQSYSSSFSKKFNTGHYISDIKAVTKRNVIEDSFFNQNKFFEMQMKIQNLEFELANYKTDRESYEKRIQFEQKRVQDLSSKMQGMKAESSSYVKERVTYEEKMNAENQKMSNLENELEKVLIDNAFLLNKINGMEEAVKNEKYQMETFSAKYQKDQQYSNSLLDKIKNYDEIIKNQKQKIFDLESKIENTNSGSDLLVTKISTYESTISNQKMQVENMMKKLQGSYADNEFLVNKMKFLTQNLRNYQYQFESLTKNLQNSKSIIALAHADLAKANAQISKYQAALSSCYTLNGQLMTQVSGMSSMAQYQTGFDSSFDILSLGYEMSMGGSATSKSIDMASTSTLLEVSGSESFMNFMQKAQSSEFDAENIM